ncbi:hypothetical protein HDU76_007006 [Blyttiomyces sp. JEL0837]|nr:hypothetical protein HDU76_007006 [Blyttiomyces sp. JEL0837]
MEDRWINWSHRVPSMYVDGTDFKVQEERPLNKDLFSHKLNHAGFRYQVATANAVPKIVWWSGGVPCGAWPDLRMVRETLVPLLEPGERVAADKGYRGEPKVVTHLEGRTPEITKHNQMLKLMGARHETVNKQLKDFGVLAQTYRGDKAFHPIIFGAVAQITNVKFQRYPPFGPVICD